MTCSGCIFASLKCHYVRGNNDVLAEHREASNKNKADDVLKCAFCRTPMPTSEEASIEREKKRTEAGDAIAIANTGRYYSRRENSFPQDYEKALELLHRAGKLGRAEAYGNIGYAYYNGRGVERDEKKALHYFKLAAMGGDIAARLKVAELELGEERGNLCKGNVDRAVKHWSIGVRSGDNESLEKLNSAT